MRCHLDIFCPRGIISRTLFADVDFFCALTRGDLVEHRYLRRLLSEGRESENPAQRRNSASLLFGSTKICGLHPQTRF